jgi:hypothetical protein
MRVRLVRTSDALHWTSSALALPAKSPTNAMHLREGLGIGDKTNSECQ